MTAERNWLVRTRKSQGISGKQLSDATGISYKSLNAYENGKRRPSVEAAKRIASVLGFDWTRFFEDDSEENTS